jgi:hypothetical protein
MGRRDIDEDCAAGWEGRTASRERVRLLGGRGIIYWAGERWKTVALLGGSGAGWERGGLLGGKGLCYWAGETWTTVALLGGRGKDCKKGESWTPRWERAGLLDRRGMDDGCAAGWEWTGLENLTAGWERGGLLGGEGGATGQERHRRRLRCWIGGGRTARRERVGLLGERGRCYWAGETWTTIALLGWLLGGRELDS